MHHLVQEDINSFSLPEQMTSALTGVRIIVTGATGVIGAAFVRCVNALGIGVRFVLPVRDAAKADAMLDNERDAVTVMQTDLIEFFNADAPQADYIVHCASPTSGHYMSKSPVETYLLAVDSMRAIMDYSRRMQVKGVVYLSSIEYYGQIFDDRPVTEDMIGHIDPRNPRNSYPLGKQAAEFLAICYAREYGVPVKIARLTQTFGAGIDKNDNRVFAQFARSVTAGCDIVLHTRGGSAKPYCYITDVISALVYIMLKGVSGEAYNVAAPGTYITIRQLAELYRDEFNPGLDIRVDDGGCDRGYAPETKVNLNSDKLMALGWCPRYGLHEMLCRLVEYMKTDN